jgi:hypothetical protein
MIAPFSIDFFRIQASAQAIITIKIVPPVIVAAGGTVIIADDGAPDKRASLSQSSRFSRKSWHWP